MEVPIGRFAAGITVTTFSSQLEYYSRNEEIPMLEKIDNPQIGKEVRDVQISDQVSLHVGVLRHKTRASSEIGSDRTALYIHGSGTAGNHTIVERPSRWLIDQDLYDTIIMPDRRGCGASTPWDHKPTIREQAQDMEALLDAMGATGSIDVLGLSAGGPIALTHADIDDRVQLVALISSSPTLGRIAWPWNWLVRIGLVPAVMKAMYRRQIGTAEPKYIDYDFMYEMEEPTRQERWARFTEVLSHMPAEYLDSVIYELNSTLDPDNTEIPADVRLEIPVLQVIGTDDETWGSEMPQKYRARFPNLRRSLIEGADHGDALTRSDEFHQALKEILLDIRRGQGA
jgi:pimeloyl-ACP methyl ester carboxylesterase